MYDLFMFRQKWQNFKNLYLEVRMLEFKTMSTITKLVTTVIILYLHMCRLATSGGNDDDQRLWAKSHALTKVDHGRFERRMFSVMNNLLMTEGSFNNVGAD